MKTECPCYRFQCYTIILVNSLWVELGMMACIYNPRTKEAEAGGSL